MPTEVVTPEGESPEVETPEAEVETPTTQPEESITTWKNRLAGKDRALSAAKQREGELAKQLDELSRWKAEKEEADMSEVDRLKKQIAELSDARAQAEATALRATLERKFPLIFDLLGDKTPLDDEAYLAEREGRLAAAKGESEPEPRVDPNNPRKPPLVKEDDSIAGLEKKLRDFGTNIYS